MMRSRSCKPLSAVHFHSFLIALISSLGLSAQSGTPVSSNGNSSTTSTAKENAKSSGETELKWNTVQVEFPSFLMKGELPFDIPFQLWGEFSSSDFPEGEPQSIRLRIKKWSEGKVRSSNGSLVEYHAQQFSGIEWKNLYSELNSGKDSNAKRKFTLSIPPLQANTNYEFEFSIISRIGGARREELEQVITTFVNETSINLRLDTTKINSANDLASTISNYLFNLPNEFPCYEIANDCGVLDEERIRQIIESERLIEKNTIFQDLKISYSSEELEDGLEEISSESSWKEFIIWLEQKKILEKTDEFKSILGMEDNSTKDLAMGRLSIKDNQRANFGSISSMTVEDWEIASKNHVELIGFLKSSRASLEKLKGKSDEIVKAIIDNFFKNQALSVEPKTIACTALAFPNLFCENAQVVRANLNANLESQIDIMISKIDSLREQTEALQIGKSEIIKSLKAFRAASDRIAERISQKVLIRTTTKTQNTVSTNFETRGKYYITSDLGLAYIPALKSIAPTFGFNFSLASLNRDSHYNLGYLFNGGRNYSNRYFYGRRCNMQSSDIASSKDYRGDSVSVVKKFIKPNFGIRLLKSTSVVIGITARDMSKAADGQVENTWFDVDASMNFSLITGIALRLSDGVRVSGGVVWMKDAASNPLFKPYPMKPLGYWSLSLDLDWGKYIKKLGERIFGLQNT